MPMIPVYMQAPRTQAARSQATRDGIAQAALTVFAFKGFATASMDDICLAAGCSKGGLYHHYPTKAAVLFGVVERLEAARALVPPFSAATGITLSPESLGRVLIEVWAEAARNDDLRQRLRRAYEAHLDADLRDGAGLAAILRVGTLVQLLTRGDTADADGLARRLGIRPAA